MTVQTEEQKLKQIQAILGKGSKAEENIYKEIKRLIDNFNLDLEVNHSILLDMCGLKYAKIDYNALEAELDVSEFFWNEFKDQAYVLEDLDGIREFIEELDSLEDNYRETHNTIKKLKDFLK